MGELKNMVISMWLGENSKRLEAASRSKIATLRICAATSLSTPPESLSKLMEDTEPMVLRQLAFNDSLSDSDANRFVDELHDPDSRISRLLKTTIGERDAAFGLTTHEGLDALHLWKLASLQGNWVTLSQFEEKSDYELGLLAVELGVHKTSSIIDRDEILAKVNKQLEAYRNQH